MRHVVAIALSLIIAHVCQAAPTWEGQTTSCQMQFKKESPEWMKSVNPKTKAVKIFWAGNANHLAKLKYATAQAREAYEEKGAPLYFDPVSGRQSDDINRMPGTISKLNPDTQKIEVTNVESVTPQELFEYFAEKGIKEFPGFRPKRIPFRKRSDSQTKDREYLSLELKAKPYNYRYYYEWVDAAQPARIVNK